MSGMTLGALSALFGYSLAPLTLFSFCTGRFWHGPDIAKIEVWGTGRMNTRLFYGLVFCTVLFGFLAVHATASPEKGTGPAGLQVHAAPDFSRAVPSLPRLGPLVGVRMGVMID